MDMQDVLINVYYNQYLPKVLSDLCHFGRLLSNRLLQLLNASFQTRIGKEKKKKIIQGKLNRKVVMPLSEVYTMK